VAAAAAITTLAAAAAAPVVAAAAAAAVAAAAAAARYVASPIDTVRAATALADAVALTGAVASPIGLAADGEEKEGAQAARHAEAEQEQLHGGLHAPGAAAKGGGGKWERINLGDATLQAQLVLYSVHLYNGNRPTLAILDATKDPIELSSKKVKRCVFVDNAPPLITGIILGSPSQACCALRDALGIGTTRGSSGVNSRVWLCANKDPTQPPKTLTLLKHAIQQKTLAGLIQARLDAQGSQ